MRAVSLASGVVAGVAGAGGAAGGGAEAAAAVPMGRGTGVLAAGQMSGVPARWRPVVWATEPATRAVAELGPYRVSARVAPTWVEAPTSVVVRAG
jgi:hypothetical protein